MLTHEIIFFHLPYLFLLKYLHLRKENINKFNFKNYYLEILILLSSTLLIFLILKFSNSHDNFLLCSSLAEVGFNNNICYGTINEIKEPSFFVPLWGYFFERNYLFNYSLYILLTLFPFFFTYLNLSHKKFSKQIFLLSVFCFLFSLVFILRVNDWGRYLNITFLMQLLVFLKFLDLNLYHEKIKINLNKYLLTFILFIYLLTWHMPHCCNPNFGNGYYDIYNRIKSRIYDNSNNSTKYNDLPREYLRKLFKID